MPMLIRPDICSLAYQELHPLKLKAHNSAKTYFNVKLVIMKK